MFTFFVILTSLFLSFLFSGMEIAYVSANKLQMHVESQKESLSGRAFFRMSKSPVRFLTTLLLGNTLALVVFGIYTASLIATWLSGYIVSQFEIIAIQTIISTAFILVAADFIPKNLFRSNPNRALQLFSLPCMVLYYLLLPFTLVVLEIVHFLMKKLFDVNIYRYGNTFTKTDLHTYIESHTPHLPGTIGIEHEVQIFKNALSFPDVKVRDCMIPRVDIIAVDITQGPAKLKERFAQTGLSRIVIYKDSIDNILGYVHFHEMFKNPDNIGAILLPAIVIPESMPAKDALRMFLQQHKSMAVVVDEFGVNSGILTTEDVFEEIFGEIEDEYDKEDLLEKEISPGEFAFSARLEIDYLNQKYNLDLPVSPDYTTLSGLLLHETGTIPKQNENIVIGDYNMRILSATPSRIEQINLTRKKQV